VRLRPHLAVVHNNLGVTLQEQKRLREALASFDRAVQLDPGYAEAHGNRGATLWYLKRLEEAVISLREALRLRPDFAEALHNLGCVLYALGRSDEAVVSLREAIRLQPGSSKAFHNLGNALRALGRFDEALASYAEVQRLRPDFADPRWASSLIWLLLGDFDKGWREYEWRWHVPSFSMCPSGCSTQPRWDGSPLAGRRILLCAEQGLGDTFQFVRYAPLVKERGGTVILECQKPLRKILAGCPGIDELVVRGDPLPPHDVCAPLMSLPRLFQTRLDTIPATIPYLKADPALVEQWRRELAAFSGLKVGITWRGNPEHPNDRQRSIPLQEFAQLAGVPGVQLVSLQHGPGSEQLAGVAGHWRVSDLGGRLDEVAGPFMDRAAVMSNLDLVVACDTSIAHLAGALGVPVWVALPQVPDWRWQLGREDSPWYPTMRLFRQERQREWGPVFQDMARAVQQRLLGASRICDQSPPQK
jgi:hypothetical protein